MKPVFCGGCEHYAIGFSDRHYEYCAKAQKKTMRSYVGEWEESEAPSGKNARNDCKDWQARVSA